MGDDEEASVFVPEDFVPNFRARKRKDYVLFEAKACACEVPIGYK
jgi:hypothetical protein